MKYNAVKNIFFLASSLIAHEFTRSPCDSENLENHGSPQRGSSVGRLSFKRTKVGATLIDKGSNPGCGIRWQEKS